MAVALLQQCLLLTPQVMFLMVKLLGDISTSEAISLKTRLMGYDQGNNYSIEILEVHPGSNFIPNDVVSVNTNNITLAEDEKSVEISGFASVKKIRVTARLEKDIIMTGSVRTDKVYFTSNTPLL